MKDSKYYTLADAQAANGAGNNVFVDDFMNKEITITADNSFAGVIKCVGCTTKESADFGSAAANDNEWFYQQIKEKDDDNNVNGSTGITYTGAEDGVRGFRINDDAITYLNFVVSGYAAGDVTVKVKASNNS